MAVWGHTGGGGGRGRGGGWARAPLATDYDNLLHWDLNSLYATNNLPVSRCIYHWKDVPKASWLFNCFLGKIYTRFGMLLQNRNVQINLQVTIQMKYTSMWKKEVNHQKILKTNNHDRTRVILQNHCVAERPRKQTKCQYLGCVGVDILEVGPRCSVHTGWNCVRCHPLFWTVFCSALRDDGGDDIGGVEFDLKPGVVVILFGDPRRRTVKTGFWFTQLMIVPTRYWNSAVGNLTAF